MGIVSTPFGIGYFGVYPFGGGAATVSIVSAPALSPDEAGTSVADLTRLANLRRVLDIDEAPRWVLDRAQQSLALPWFESLPDELVRRFLRYATEFNTLSGSMSGSYLLLYLFGFRVRFEYLYAHKDDYEGKVHPWVPQASYLHLMSSGDPEGTVYAEVASQHLGTYEITLEDNHVVLVGDLITNDTHEFENFYRRVIGVSGNVITVDYQCDVYAGDYLSIIRQPDYPLNPDPDNYFPIPWIDVYVKSDLLADFDMSFTDLRTYLEERLPANVNIRYITYDSDIPFHSYQFSQTLFRMLFTNIYEFSVGEVSAPDNDSTTLAGDSDVIIVVDDSPVTGYDAAGAGCDVYSYVLTSTAPFTYTATEVNPDE